MKEHYTADDLLTRVYDIKDLRKKCIRDASRFRDYPYLDAVYQFYAEIRTQNVKPLAFEVFAEDLKLKITRDPHLIRAIINGTCKADSKTKSRWTRALRYAWKQRDHWDRLPRFIRRNGGISGCASWFTETRHWRHRKTNRTRLPSDGQIRLMKKRAEGARARWANFVKSRPLPTPIIVQRRLTVGDLDRMAARERGANS